MLRSGREHAEALQRQHPKFRHFQDELDPALIAFEKVQEWPDLIKSLSRVNRVLAKYAAVEAIPSLVMLAKRLAQCLHPGLPAGVHLKALETYGAVFGRLGHDLLLQSLGLFSAGLFPLLAYASTRVRPDLIKLYEDYYLPLGDRLVPALNGFILALLPGVEDNTSETYSRVMRLLNDTRTRTNPAVFALSLWRAMLLCPPCRLAAVNYISVTIPTKMEDMLISFLPSNRTIAVDAIIATLHDQNVLAQRGMFEILIAHFPINSEILTPEQKVAVLHGALPVLLRREASVNRRFFSWLLRASDGSDELVVSDETISLLALALKKMMEDVSETIVAQDIKVTKVLPSSDESVRPFELLNLLMEKVEIQTSSLLELLNYTVISYAYQWHCFGRAVAGGKLPGSPKSTLQDLKLEAEEKLSLDVLKAAQSFFRNRIVERIWKCVLKMLEDEFSRGFSLDRGLSLKVRAHDDPRIEALMLVDFALDFLPLPQENMQELEADSIAKLLECMIEGLYSLEWCTESLKCALQFTLKLLQRAKSPKQISKGIRVDFLKKFKLISAGSVASGVAYAKPSSQSLKSTIKISRDQFQLSTPTYYAHRRIPTSLLETISLSFHLLEIILTVEVEDAMFGANSESIEFARTLVQKYVDHLITYIQFDDPDLSCIGTHSWIEIQLKKLTSESGHDGFLIIARKLWSLLSPEYSDHHHQVSELFNRLEKLDRHACNEVIADAMLQKNDVDCVEGYRRFSILWSMLFEISPHRVTFQDSLMLMLDALEDKRPNVRLVARTWLQDSLDKVDRVLDPLCELLLDPSTVRKGQFYEYTGLYDARFLLYVLQKLHSVLMCDFSSMLNHLNGRTISRSTADKYNSVEAYLLKHKSDSNNQAPNTQENMVIPAPTDYVDLVCYILLRFIQGTVGKDKPVIFQ